MVCQNRSDCNAGQIARSKEYFPALSNAGRTLTWVDMVALYPAPQECLAAFLVTSAAEVLAGVKPANLIRIGKRELPCGRCMFRLWQEHGKELLSGATLQALALREEADGVLLLLYRPELLEARLRGRTMKAFLTQRGYPRPLTLDGILARLQDDYRKGGSPDEVGVFLGYPLKDVKGFMNRGKNIWQGRCLWRVYGPPSRSLRLYRSFCREREAVTQKLAAGWLPNQLLGAV